VPAAPNSTRRNRGRRARKTRVHARIAPTWGHRYAPCEQALNPWGRLSLTSIQQRNNKRTASTGTVGMARQTEHNVCASWGAQPTNKGSAYDARCAAKCGVERQWGAVCSVVCAKCAAPAAQTEEGQAVRVCAAAQQRGINMPRTTAKPAVHQQNARTA